MLNWQDAMAIVGDGQSQDFVLQPGTHGALYRDSAPDLAGILLRAGPQETARSYALFDQAAIEAQRRYRRWMRLTNVGALLTSVSGAAAMAWGLVPEVAAPPLSWGGTGFSLAAVASAALGTAGLYMLRSGQLLETWMNKRAHAETLRIGYFEEVLAQAQETGAQTSVLALEYFRRFQLDVQKAFFFSRARQHERSAQKTTTIGAIGAALATLSSIAGVSADGGWAAIGVVTVFGAALGAFAVGREQMTQDRRNAERYDRTYAALSEITRTLDRVRPAVQAGKLDAMQEFAASVNDHISNEHRQWLDQADATRTALARIEATLTLQPPSDT